MLLVDAINQLQTPLSDLKGLQIMRGKPVSENGKDEKMVNTQVNQNPPDSVAKGIDAAFSFSAVPPYRNQTQLISSTKTTTSKMTKLKSELFSILYTFPEKALKWPELDAASEQLIQSAGETAANNVNDLILSSVPF